MSRQNFLGDEPWDKITDFPATETGDKGIIARFEVPAEE
jgi:hypothetical protein